MLRLSFIAERRKGLRPLRKSRRERGLHLNASLSVEQPCYEAASVEEEDAAAGWGGRWLLVGGGGRQD